MIEFEKPNIECLEVDDTNNYAKFVCEPLERGYGVTIGNSLRRILLSSLPGCAITSAKIDGVLHEFSTVPNVVEDVPEIIVNLKSVRLKFSENEEKILRIDHKGEGEVLAGDIITDDISAATGNFTNYLTGVKILGDLIEANTIIADKIVIRGYDENGNLSNSLVYALNHEGNIEATDVPPGEIDNYQLDGKILIAKSVTANKIYVEDLWVNGIANMLNANINTAMINDLTALTSNIGNWHIEGGVIASNS